MSDRQVQGEIHWRLSPGPLVVLVLVKRVYDVIPRNARITFPPTHLKLGDCQMESNGKCRKYSDLTEENLCRETEM